MISDTHKFIFVHLPRTGGTSISKILKKYGGYYETYQKKQINAHIPLSVSLERDVKRAEYFKFTCIRNIYERLISMVFFKCRQCDKVKKSVAIDYFNQICDDPSMVTLVNLVDAPIDFTMRFDHLEKDWFVVSKKLGFSKTSLSVCLKTKHKHYISYYTDEMRQRVQEVFADEIEQYNWKFEK